MTTPYKRLDKDQAVVLLVDHQTGLLSLVRDIDPDKFKNNVLALADLAKYFNLPTILTTSFEEGPNGPLVPELKDGRPVVIDPRGIDDFAMIKEVVTRRFRRLSEEERVFPG